MDSKTPTRIPFNPQNGFRAQPMPSKSEMAGDMLRATVLLRQTETRRLALERFLLAVLLKSGPISVCLADIDAAAGYHLKQSAMPLEADKTTGLFSAEKNNPTPQEPSDVQAG